MSENTEAIEVTGIYDAGMLAVMAFGGNKAPIPFFHGRSEFHMKVVSIENCEDESRPGYDYLLIRGMIVSINGSYEREPAECFIMYDPALFFGLLSYDDKEEQEEKEKKKNKYAVQFNLFNIRLGGGK